MTKADGTPAIAALEASDLVFEVVDVVKEGR